MEETPKEPVERAFWKVVRCNAHWHATRERKRRGEHLYETLRALTEEAPEKSIAALVVTNDPDVREEMIKSVFRASVYGEISLLFGNVFTKEDAAGIKEDAKRAFCSLLEEEREFNGFIPKGPLIDTPLALLSNGTMQGWDFFCLDEARVCDLLCGSAALRSEPLARALETLIQSNLPKTLSRYTLPSDCQ